MNDIISKIEIDGFRSIRKQTIEVNNINVFSGLNDVGKSNILKALNLFFCGRTDFGVFFNFANDYSKVAQASAQKSAKKKQQVKIKIYFKAPSSFKTLTNKKLWVERVFDRENVKNEITSLDGQKEKRSLTRLVNSIQYFYIPALKGQDVMNYILGEVGKRKLISEGDISELNEKVNASIIDLANILLKSTIKTETNFSLPVLVEDFWQKLNINTTYDEFEKLNREINPSKKGNADPLNKEFYQIPLQLRGEGVKSKHIPPLLQWIQEREKNRYYIWGIDEPENSLEFKKAQEVADLYFKEYKKCAQLFLTSHSLAFIFPDQFSELFVFRCTKGYFGDTKIELLQSLFEKQDKLNLAEEIGALEIQKQFIKGWRLKNNEINDLKNIVSSLTKPVIFVEGEIDKKYCDMTLELFGKTNYPADIKWIGYKNDKGDVQFSGKDSLDKAEQYLVANQPFYKTVLFYDVDCKKKYFVNKNVIVYCPNKIINAKYKTGAEHLLSVPTEFNIDVFIKTHEKGDKTTTEPNKEKILDHVMSLSHDKQRNWLSNFNKILDELENLINIKNN